MESRQPEHGLRSTLGETCDDLKEDGERLNGGVVVMDKEYRDNVVREEHVLVPKRYTSRAKTWSTSGSRRGAPDAYRSSQEPLDKQTLRVAGD